MTAIIDDATYLTKDGTEDPHLRADYYSGKRGKGNCLIVGHQVDLKGRFLALRPPNIAATPRGSDTITMALQVGIYLLIFLAYALLGIALLIDMYRITIYIYYSRLSIGTELDHGKDFCG